MKDLFFGWITRPHMQVTFLDRFFEWTECFALLIVALLLWAVFSEWKRSRRVRK